MGEGQTHRASGQLPVEGLRPRQHVLHTQLHGQLVDVLWEGVGQAGLPAGQHSTTTARVPTLCLVLGIQRRKDRLGGAGGWGEGEVMSFQTFCHRQDTMKGKDTELSP